MQKSISQYQMIFLFYILFLKYVKVKSFYFSSSLMAFTYFSGSRGSTWSFKDATRYNTSKLFGCKGCLIFVTIIWSLVELRSSGEVLAGVANSTYSNLLKFGNTLKYCSANDFQTFSWILLLFSVFARLCSLMHNELIKGQAFPISSINVFCSHGIFAG